MLEESTVYGQFWAKKKSSPKCFAKKTWSKAKIVHLAKHVKSGADERVTLYGQKGVISNEYTFRNVFLAYTQDDVRHHAPLFQRYVTIPWNKRYYALCTKTHFVLQMSVVWWLARFASIRMFYCDRDVSICPVLIDIETAILSMSNNVYDTRYSSLPDSALMPLRSCPLCFISNNYWNHWFRLPSRHHRKTHLCLSPPESGGSITSPCHGNPVQWKWPEFNIEWYLWTQRRNQNDLFWLNGKQFDR